MKVDETSRHTVAISKAFYLGKYEVTQEQWVAVMGSNPSEFKGRTNPVEKVSWDDVQEFLRRLNSKEGTNPPLPLPGGEYRLPTEAEWEYACRAGATTTYSFGDDADQVGQYAWYDGNSGEKTHPVGQLKPNAWGLYDMHGNVYEWCQDWYGETYYSQSPAKDPQGPGSGNSRLLRGGSWYANAPLVRCASRISYAPASRDRNIGVRVAAAAKP